MKRVLQLLLLWGAPARDCAGAEAEREIWGKEDETRDREGGDACICVEAMPEAAAAGAGDAA